MTRYELRFHNGDVLFSNKRDIQLVASAYLLIDHQDKTVVKNRTGEIGHQVYAQMFPDKEIEFNINTNVRLKENGQYLDVYANNQLLLQTKDDAKSHFEIWRLLSRLSKVGK